MSSDKKGRLAGGCPHCGSEYELHEGVPMAPLPTTEYPVSVANRRQNQQQKGAA